MRSLARRACAVAAALLVALCLATASAQPTHPVDAPYRDPGLPTAERVADLLARMTLEEKLGQMAQVNVARLAGEGAWDMGPLDPTFVQRWVVDVGIGSVLSGGGFAPVPNTPESWAEMTNALQRAAVEGTRLGIPLVYGVDAVHGHNNVLGAVLYPHNLGVAATGDVDLARRIAARTAADVRATGVQWNFAPVADVGVDPRWGRFYETFGEEPKAVSAFVRAAVEGMQGAGLDAPNAVAATVKHFVGYGAGADGRDRAPATLGRAQLEQIHVPPARAGIEAGAATVMANSGAVNGVPVHASHELLTDLLRGELGFGGLVVSDWEDLAKLATVYRWADDYGEAVATGVRAGIDMSMVPNDAERFVQALEDAVERGDVPPERIDAAVGRILTLKFDLGLFEDPYVDPLGAATELGDPGDVALAYEAAAASLTVLKNDGVLPLPSEPDALLVAGPAADDLAAQLGGWSIGWQGLPAASPAPPGTTVAEALRARYGDDVVMLRTAIGSAVADASDANVAVLVLGEPPYAEGAGDVADLALPGPQLQLLRGVVATGTPTVVVLIAGRPRTIPDDVLEAVDALVMAYLPGSEGGPAIADLLAGDVEPAGRLPFSWPSWGASLPVEAGGVRFARGSGQVGWATGR